MAHPIFGMGSTTSKVSRRCEWGGNPQTLTLGSGSVPSAGKFAGKGYNSTQQGLTHEPSGNSLLEWMEVSNMCTSGDDEDEASRDWGSSQEAPRPEPQLRLDPRDRPDDGPTMEVAPLKH